MRKKNRCEKKRIAALILGSVLLFASLSGCGSEAPSKEERSSTSATEISSGEDMPYDTEGTDDPTENWIVNDETGSSEEETVPASETEGTEPETEAPEPAAETEPELQYIEGYRVKVTVPSARVRSESNLECEVLGAAAEGEVFDVTGTEKAFYVIRFHDTTAYLHQSVVSYGAYEKPVPPPTEAPTAPPVPVTKAEYVPGNGQIVCLDAGHRPEGQIPGVEPIGPGASETKRKLSTGTQGTASDGKVYLERDINLQVTMRTKAILESRGYTVFLTNRQLTNSERALEASASGASIYVRIHCNGSDDHSVRGLLTYSPKPGNPFLSDALIAESERLSVLIGQHASQATGARNIGVLNANDMTGSNWSKIPVTIIEMGFMTNVEECTLLASPDYQEKLALGMADGIDAYFGK